MSELAYTLTLSETQARTTAEALEFFMRYCIGQFDVPMVVQCRPTPPGYNVPEGKCQERDELLLKLRSLFFPELHGLGHSYGVGNRNGQPEQKAAMVAYDLYKHILHEFHKDSSISNVHSFPPMLHYSDQPKPIFTKIQS